MFPFPFLFFLSLFILHFAYFYKNIKMLLLGVATRHSNYIVLISNIMLATIVVMNSGVVDTFMDNTHIVIVSTERIISDYIESTIDNFHVDIHLELIKEAIEDIERRREREGSIIDVLLAFRHRALSWTEEKIKQYKKFETTLENLDSNLATLR